MTTLLSDLVPKRHDADAVLDYGLDLTDWLAEPDDADALVSCTWDVVRGTATLAATATGGTPGTQAVTGTVAGAVAGIWVRTASPGTVELRCRWTTANGRIDDRTVRLLVSDR